MSKEVARGAIDFLIEKSAIKLCGDIRGIPPKIIRAGSLAGKGKELSGYS